MIAALYVETNGAYYGLDGVDPWDEERDARLYDGPHPVVAHPPCPRWGKMWFGQPLTVKTTCCVEQGRYGHYARKPTLLYAVGCDLPELEWGHSPMNLDPAVVERMGLERAKRLGEVGARGGGTDSTPRIHTPEPFRDLLIGMARSVRRDELPLFRSAA